jgi:hypothetical protein
MLCFSIVLFSVTFAGNALASEEVPARADVCWESEIASLEEAVGERGLVRHCESVRYQLQYEGETYAEYLRDYYRVRRIVGWQLAAGLAPIGIGAAVGIGVAWYRATNSHAENDEDSGGSMVNMGYLGVLIFPIGIAACTLGALTSLVTGIILIHVGTVREERVERFMAGQSSAGARSPRLAITPHVDPSGAGGLSLSLTF